ncbi:MAG TPA: hypothetical protein VER55_12825 [Ardenticatenaceae bacterium]|nr:hypothetical protein [Ardenticatenaceae bacterium]
MRKSLASLAPQFLQRLIVWVPIVTSLVSLTIAVSSYAVATRAPEVVLVPPRQVRVAQGGEAAFLYVQPTFLSAGRNNRAEVILTMRLEVAPVESESSVEFYWDEQGAWQPTGGSQELSWVFVSDPVPLLVTPQSPQLPVGLFIGPPEWAFEPGTYRVTVVAERGVVSTPLRDTFEVELSQEDIDFLNASNGTRFLTFPTR